MAAKEIINWEELVSDPQFYRKGRIDPQLVLQWFQGQLNHHLTDEVRKVEASRRRDEQRIGSIHQVFEEMGKDKLPRDTIVQATLISLQVPTKDIQEETRKILAHLELSDDFATYSAGPASGIVRTRNVQGRETSLYNELKNDPNERSRLYNHSAHNPGLPTRNREPVSRTREQQSPPSELTDPTVFDPRPPAMQESPKPKPGRKKIDMKF